MKRGIVMEISKRYMVVLTKDGEFIRVKLNADVDIGEEVYFSRIPLYSFPHFYDQKLYSVPLAFFSMLLTVFPRSSFIELKKVYGIVSLDINSSIELTIDSSYKVLYMNGYNEKGKQLLGAIDASLEGKTLEKVTTLLLKEGFKQGLIESPESIFISSSVEFDKANNWGANFYSWSSSIVNKYGFDVYPVHVEAEISEKAKQLSISPVKYLLLTQHDEEFDYMNMSNASITDIEKDVGNSVKDLAKVVFLSDDNIKGQKK